MGALARSAPDGHTIVMTVSSTVALNPFVVKDLPYDPFKDLAPITNLAEYGLMFLGSKDYKAGDFAGYLAAAKEKPDQITVGFTSTVGRLISAMIEEDHGARLRQVPFTSVGSAQTALTGGVVNSLIDQVASAKPLIDGGNVVGLAVTTAGRSPKYPDIPTVAEVIPGFEVVSWYGFFAPAGTPQARIDALNKALVATLQDEKVKSSLAQCECQPIGSTPDEFAKTVRDEYDRNKTISEKYKLVD
jgi:tripartite-type tricarboxylate transporter receptor subunit TctC